MRHVSELIADMNRYHAMHPRITRIDPDVTAVGTPRWTVSFDDGRQGSTVKRDLAAECYRLQDLHVPCAIQRSKMRYGWALVSIKEGE